MTTPYVAAVLVSKVTPESLRLAAVETDRGETEYQMEIEGAGVTLFVPNSTINEYRRIGNRILLLCDDADEAAFHREADNRDVAAMQAEEKGQTP